ncbi:hypothetical protein [Streptomyces sp. NPDC003032]
MHASTTPVQGAKGRSSPPSTPGSVHRAALVQTDDVDTARDFAGAEPRMPELLADAATRIVVPVTTLPGPDTGEPCEDSFAPETLGHIFTTPLRT